MKEGYIRLINNVLPLINFVMLIIVLVLAFKLSLQWLKKKEQEAKNENKTGSFSVVIIVSKDGIFQVLDAKTVEILSLSPLMIKDLKSQTVYQKDGKYYIFYKENVVLITDLKYREMKGQLYNNYLPGGGGGGKGIGSKDGDGGGESGEKG